MPDGEDDAAAAAGGMTIDELARRSGVTSRNIRAYQSRGLLPPPSLRGRVGLYDEAHLVRLRLVGRLQQQGFSLAAIGELLRAWEEGRSLSDVLGLEEELTARWSEEESELLDQAQLAELFPAARSEQLREAVELGLLEPEGDRYRAPSPALLRIGAQLTAIGVPLDATLAAHRRLRRRADEIAADFVALFEDHIWQPFEEAGRPPERFREIARILQQLRPLAFETVRRMLAAAMEARADVVVAERVLAQGTDAVAPGSPEDSGPPGDSGSPGSPEPGHTGPSGRLDGPDG